VTTPRCWRCPPPILGPRGISELGDVPDRELNEIAHFFAIYNHLVPGKETMTHGWQGREAAEKVIEDCRHRFGQA
jgi:inorganic pyrophosphatase